MNYHDILPVSIDFVKILYIHKIFVYEFFDNKLNQYCIPFDLNLL